MVAKSFQRRARQEFLRVADSSRGDIVQLIGVTHPNPAKKDEFRVWTWALRGRRSMRRARPASVISCTSAWRSPLPYEVYIEVRAEAEKMIRESE